MKICHELLGRKYLCGVLNLLLVFCIENISINDYAKTFGEIRKVKLKINFITFIDVTVKCMCLRKR
jgi:branched-subunit amino acid transport protein AzlD